MFYGYGGWNPSLFLGDASLRIKRWSSLCPNVCGLLSSGSVLATNLREREKQVPNDILFATRDSCQNTPRHFSYWNQ